MWNHCVRWNKYPCCCFRHPCVLTRLKLPTTKNMRTRNRHNAGIRRMPLSSSLNWLCKAGFSKPSFGRFRPLHSLIKSSLLICWKGCTSPFLLSLPAGPAMTFLLRSSRVVCEALSDATWSAFYVDDIVQPQQPKFLPNCSPFSTSCDGWSPWNTRQILLMKTLWEEVIFVVSLDLAIR